MLGFVRERAIAAILYTSSYFVEIKNPTYWVIIPKNAKPEPTIKTFCIMDFLELFVELFDIILFLIFSI